MLKLCLLQCKNNFCINVCTWSIFTPFEKKLILNFVKKSAFSNGKVVESEKKKNYKLTGIMIYLIAGQTLDNHTEQL